MFAELEARLAPAVEGGQVEWLRSAELRYGGQTWEVEVELPAGAPDVTALIAAFEDEHERLYGVRGEPGSPIEIRALRLAALGPSSAVDRLSLDDRRPSGRARVASLRRRPVDAPVRTRASIGAAPEPGPLLVDEYDTTVVVRPGWTVRRDATTETLILERPMRDRCVARAECRRMAERTCPFGRSGYPPPAPMRSSLPPKS